MQKSGNQMSVPSSDPHADFGELRSYMNTRIIGQPALVDRLLISLLSNGHLLVEGAPGLAKTTAIKCLANAIEGDFHRIQFTPDLLPGDVTGTDVYRPQDGRFEFQPGPIFHNLVLADEITRAPAKVQSALLEAMGERQITVGQASYQLPSLFMVMATQNPIEQEGTYPLPEAQLDRFLMYVSIGHPPLSAEYEILRAVRHHALTGGTAQAVGAPQVPEAQIHHARRAALSVHMADNVESYIVALVGATREPQDYDEHLPEWIRFGASPRATLALDACARGHAWLNGRDYVSPEDVQAIAPDVLRHRVLLSFEAEADGITGDHLVQMLLDRVPVP